jgi:hypothetical protein
MEQDVAGRTAVLDRGLRLVGERDQGRSSLVGIPLFADGPGELQA